MPSTSWLDLLSGPLTPVGQFIHNSRKSKNKEPKDNRSQRNHHDRQSVLGTRTRQGYQLWTFVFVRSSSPFAHMVINSTNLPYGFSTMLSIFTSFQITMTKCHKIFPNCISHVRLEWHGLYYFSALSPKCAGTTQLTSPEHVLHHSIQRLLN